MWISTELIMVIELETYLSMMMQSPFNITLLIYLTKNNYIVIVNFESKNYQNPKIGIQIENEQNGGTRMFFRVSMTAPVKMSYIKRYTCSLTEEKKIENKGNNIKLVIVLSGELNVFINNEEIVVSESSWLIMPPRSSYRFVDQQNESVSIMEIEFTSDLNIVYSAIPFDDGLNKNTAILPQIGQLRDIEEFNSLTQLMMIVFKGKGLANVSCNYLMSSLLILINSQFIVSLENNDIDVVPAKFEWIIAWITEHCEEELTVNAVAAKFDITSTYLTHLFHVYKHCSTIKFIHQIKISKARDLLVQTNLSVKQIAYYLSFKNVKYFMRLFKQETGFTPTSFRNNFSKARLTDPV